MLFMNDRFRTQLVLYEVCVNITLRLWDQKSGVCIYDAFTSPMLLNIIGSGSSSSVLCTFATRNVCRIVGTYWAATFDNVWPPRDATEGVGLFFPELRGTWKVDISSIRSPGQSQTLKRTRRQGIIPLLSRARLLSLHPFVLIYSWPFQSCWQSSLTLPSLPITLNHALQKGCFKYLHNSINSKQDLAIFI